MAFLEQGVHFGAKRQVVGIRLVSAFLAIWGRVFRMGAVRIGL